MRNSSVLIHSKHCSKLPICKLHFIVEEKSLVQSAYAIDTSVFDNDLKPYFNKTELKYSDESANCIYNFFERGRQLFPEEIILSAVDKIRNYKINDKNIIPKNLLFEYCKKYKLNFNIYRAKMSKIYKVTDKKIYKIFPAANAEISSYIEKTYISQLGERNSGKYQ